MRILFLGDIVGQPGRRAVRQNISLLKKDLKVDCVIANGENASGGIGITPKNADQLHGAGIDIITSGNHIWKHKDIYSFLEENSWLLRPANYPPGVPGKGYGTYKIGQEKIAVINLQGRIFMEDIDCPFRTGQKVLEELDKDIKLIIVDFHAEATSEKKALLYYFQKKVSALLGTHTHVQTTDELILAKHTAYISDAGMCGAYDSIIGMDVEAVLKRFVQRLPQKFIPAKGDVILQGVLLEADPQSGKAKQINRFNRYVKAVEHQKQRRYQNDFSSEKPR